MARKWTTQHAYLDGVRFKEAEKMTPSMQRMLWDVKLYDNAYYSRQLQSEKNAAHATLHALRLRRCLDGLNHLTELGEKMVGVEWRDAPETPSYSKRGPKPLPTLARAQFDILDHAQNRAAGGLFCGGGEVMDGLVEAGLMEYAGKKSFVPDPYYRITSKGQATLRAARERKSVMST